MKYYFNCPKCSDPLVNDDKGTFIFKSCTSKLDHKLKIIYDARLNPVSLVIYFDTKIELQWYFEENALKIYKNHPNDEGLHKYSLEEIPWIDPDLDNYVQFMRKMKKYLLFL